MKRRTALAIARAEKRARYKGGQQATSKYGLKRIKLLTGYPYTEENCPGHIGGNIPKICERCGVHIDSLRPPDDVEF